MKEEMSFELTAIYAALSWKPKLLKFIKLIKENPIIYALDKSAKKKKFSQKEKDAWKDISKVLDWSPWICKKKWETIRNQYGKLKCLIDSGKLPVGLNKDYVVIKKYFNGSLSFLDPHLGDLSNPKMLKCFPTTKKFDNVMRKLCQVNCEQVNKFLKKDKRKKLSDAEDLNCKDNEYITSIISAGIKQSLNALFFVEPTEDIQCIETEVVENEETNNIETCDCTVDNNQIGSDRECSDEINWDDITDSLMELKESGTLINSSDNLIKIEEEFDEINTMSSKENASTFDEINTMSSKENASTFDEINTMRSKENASTFDQINTMSAKENASTFDEINTMSSKENASTFDEINTMSAKENDSTKLVKNQNSESGVSDAEMRHFFEELGYAMSQELSLEKQVKLQIQINNLIKRTRLNKPS